MFQTKLVDEIRTHILCLVTFFFFENRAVYGVMWTKHGGARETTDDNTWDTEKMRFASRVTKARIQTHPNNILYLLPHDLLMPSVS